MSSNAKVMVMFTDGKTTSGIPPAPVAAAARAAGIIIYCIGLTGADGIDVSVLNDWATDPDASHVAFTPDDAELEDLFADLAANISKPGATDIVIDEIINPDFVITSITWIRTLCSGRSRNWESQETKEPHWNSISGTLPRIPAQRRSISRSLTRIPRGTLSHSRILPSLWTAASSSHRSPVRCPLISRRTGAKTS